MKPRVKFGLIVGLVGLVLNICVATAVGICGPLTGLVAGAVAGFLAAHQEKVGQKGNGARLGAVAGMIAGALVLVGQVIGAVGTLAFYQFTGTPIIFGEIPSTSANISEQLIYYVTGLGTGMCFGIFGIVLAAMAGAAAGYLGTSEQPTIAESN
jgi:hypothetical protein